MHRAPVARPDSAMTCDSEIAGDGLAAAQLLRGLLGPGRSGWLVIVGPPMETAAQKRA